MIKKVFKVKYPVGERILVRLAPVEEVTASGIITMTATQKSREQVAAEYGYVEQLGELSYHDCGPAWCKVGDLIAFAKYSGMDFKYNGNTYRVINDRDVVAVGEEVEEDV